MQISVNGQTYDRWEDVPEELRTQLAAALPDQDHDGVPDIFQDDSAAWADLAKRGRVQTVTSISMNGHEVGSVHELPPEMQTLLRRALGVDGADGADGADRSDGAGTTGAARPPTVEPGSDHPQPTQPLPRQDQMLLNGVPTSVDGGVPAEPRKGFLRRLLGR